MEKYIPLDALLAWAKKTYLCENASAIRKVCYKQLVEHLNVLEVKEVDLQKEIQTQWKGCEPIDEGMGCEFANISVEQFDSIAKHFFELGLSASNPLTWEDINSILYIERLVLREFGGQEHSNEELCREVLKGFKEQKGKKI